ncbi:MAG: diacylglycerol kinase family lipid kinase [Nitrospirae bacterium]|nr:diacylglycerol kinase family lipid kinase [Nitrospirota bacterium]
MNRAVVIVNPTAGGAKNGGIERAVELVRKRVKSCELLLTGKRGDAEELARRSRDADLVIAAGGDGTFNEVINGIAPESGTVAFIPMGTTNVFSFEMGQPKKLNEIVSRIFDSPPRAISLGMANGRYFALMAGAGFDGETVFRMNDSLKRRFGKAAYLLAGLRLWLGGTSGTITVQTDSRTTLECHTAIVSNASCYGGPIRLADVSMEDPWLVLTAFAPKSWKAIPYIALNLALGRPIKRMGVTAVKVRSAELVSDRPMRYQLDGDRGGTLPVHVSIAPSAIFLRG